VTGKSQKEFEALRLNLGRLLSVIALVFCVPVGMLFVWLSDQKNERHVGHFDKEAYRKRNVVEKTINRLKQFRRLATRYQKRAVNYRGMLTIAAIVLWV
jgi:Transposase DDE domain